MARVSQCPDTAIQMQKTAKGAQAQHIGKIVCVTGNEIDREASTTHSGMLASNFKKNLMKTSLRKVRECERYDSV